MVKEKPDKKVLNGKSKLKADNLVPATAAIRGLE